LIGIFSIVLFSCSSEDKSTETEKKQSLNETDSAIETPVEDIQISGPVAIEEVKFEQASSGLENAVALYYLDQYEKGELKSILKGSARKMYPEKNKVYLDTELKAYDGLGFFIGKYPEFLISTENVVHSPDTSLMHNTRVNSEQFIDGSASDYLLNKENFNLGDLQIMISKAFYYEGAYYVHAWELSNSTDLFHNQRLTFKFNNNLDMVDHSGVNTGQMGYSRAEQYLKNQDMLAKEYN
jgi:hypothetical protein